jgi:glycosyltransferase involved in cell wall biosynthesis
LIEYWPEVVVEPDLRSATLVITGVGSDQLHKLTGISPEEQNRLRIKATGFLPSLLSTFEGALALVSPTFVGGGIRKKILEGMANQVPVIATNLDVDTCDFFDPPNNILRLGDPQEFVATLFALASDAEFWFRLAAAGRETVERHANWDKFANTIVNELVTLLNVRSNR